MKSIKFDMQSKYVKFINWHMRRSLDQIGLAGVVGLGLLVFSGMYFFSALLPAKHEVQLSQRELDAMPVVPMESQKKQQSVDQLQVFYATFPSVNAAPDALARLNEEALANGVILDQGEYTLVRNEADKLVRYGVSLPIKGDYVSVRKFLSKTLADIPYIALDSVEFQRPNIGDTTLEAQVRMTFFLVDN